MPVVPSPASTPVTAVATALGPLSSRRRPRPRRRGDAAACRLSAPCHLPLTPPALPRYPYPMTTTATPCVAPAIYPAHIPNLIPLIVRSAPFLERRSIKQTRPAAPPAGYEIRTRTKKRRPYDQTPHLARPAPSNSRYTNTIDRPYAPRDGRLASR